MNKTLEAGRPCFIFSPRKPTDARLVTCPGLPFASLLLTIALCWQSRSDLPRLISLLIFGLSMLELYTISALYHIGRWHARTDRVLRAIDHANIFVMIAGTYTPLCFNLLSGWLRVTILLVIWILAAIGGGLAIFTLRLPRWITAALYIGMGWVSSAGASGISGSGSLVRRSHIAPGRYSLYRRRGGLRPQTPEPFSTRFRLPRDLSSVRHCR